MNSDTKFQFHLNDISGSSYYNSLWPKAMVPSQDDFATAPTQALAFSGHLPMSWRHLGLLKLGGRGTTAIKWDATKHHRNPGLKVRTKQHIWTHPHMYTMKLNPT